MADRQTAITAAFPTPPPFYKHFTKQNLSKLQRFRKEAGASTLNGDVQQGFSLLSLPTELRYLIPPSPPPENQYRTFGASINLNAPDASLKEAGIEQLFPDDPAVQLNPSPHLIALTRSLLTTYLSLVGILSQNPIEYYEERTESLQTIMYNIHDLINQYRPHQARESLIALMEERVDRMKDETRRIIEAKAKVEEIMQGLRHGAMLQRTDTDSEHIAMRANEEDQDNKTMRNEEKIRMHQRSAWAAIEHDIT